MSMKSSSSFDRLNLYHSRVNNEKSFILKALCMIKYADKDVPRIVFLSDQALSKENALLFELSSFFVYFTLGNSSVYSQLKVKSLAYSFHYCLCRKTIFATLSTSRANGRITSILWLSNNIGAFLSKCDLFCTFFYSYRCSCSDEEVQGMRAAVDAGRECQHRSLL